MSANKRTLAGTQKKAVILIAALIVILALVLVFVNYLTDIDTFEDIDGTKYRIKRSGDVYALFDSDGYMLDTTVENKITYYVTKLGTLVSVGSNGSTSIYAVVDTDDGEDLSSFNNLMIYKKIDNANIQTIKITNRAEGIEGSYIFNRDKNGDMRLKGHESIAFDAEAYAYLASICGNTTTMRKISNEALAKYGFEEYGLDAPQSTMTIIDTSGTTHTLEIGKQIVSGNGYYVRLVGRDAVYIMNAYVGKYILQPVEFYVSPILHYGLSEQNYMFVYNLKMTDFDYAEDGTTTANLITALSYWDYAERENTEFQTQAYYMTDESLDSYSPSSDAVYEAMGSFLQMEYIGVKKLGADIKTRTEFGLDKPAKALYYESERTDSGKTYYLKSYLYFSELTESGTYYVVSDVYLSDQKDGNYHKLDNFDYIVEIDRSWLDWLEWDTLDWIERDYFQINIGIIDYMEFKLPDGSQYRFELVQIDENAVKAYAIKNGTRTPIDTRNFQTLYLNMLGGKLFGSAKITVQRAEEITTAPDRHRLTWSFKTTTGLERTHSYYLLEGNKDYITINGDGGFYVLSSVIKKLSEDVVSVYNGIKIAADSPYTNIDK